MQIPLEGSELTKTDQKLYLTTKIFFLLPKEAQKVRKKFKEASTCESNKWITLNLLMNKCLKFSSNDLWNTIFNLASIEKHNTIFI